MFLDALTSLTAKSNTVGSTLTANFLSKVLPFFNAIDAFTL